MAAPKGNKYAIGNNGGHPPIYDNPETLEDKIIEYFEACIINEENITITGLALYLGFDSRTSFYEYWKKEEFMYIIKRARLVVENRYENNLYSNACTGAIFALKNMDWHDKSEVDHTNKGEKFEPIDYTLLDDSVLRAIIKAGKPKEG